MRAINKSHRGILLLACAVLLQAQAPPASEKARAMMEELRVQTGSPGLSAAVAVDGKIVWAEGFGLADAENQVPVSPESRFRLGSISKLITVAAAAKLVEAGKLDLDAPVQRYVPSFPAKEQPITPRQLAGHLAGIRHYNLQDFSLPVRRYERLTEGLGIFQNDPLVHAPGSAYLYSSYGYNLFGAVVEGAAGKDFGGAVDELVIQPLGLKSTALDYPERILERRVRFYRKEADGTLANEGAIDSSYKWPSAGFLSTASDLVRFGSAHLRDGFLKPETRSLLFTSQRTAAGEETGVGIGWRIGKDGAGRRFLHHGGAIDGGRAFLLLYPDQKIAVAILANLSGARYAEGEAQKLAELFLETD
ncbi:MAG TPA: serine hydrolase domain-containing protein [Thermoanaerobaculia bacterium]|nr:serine hydrolase domain-containing protein [Thermoanaerobaculia bacterium]